MARWDPRGSRSWCRGKTAPRRATVEASGKIEGGKATVMIGKLGEEPPKCGARPGRKEGRTLREKKRGSHTTLLRRGCPCQGFLHLSLEMDWKKSSLLSVKKGTHLSQKKKGIG